MQSVRSGGEAHAETGFVGDKADTYAQKYADETPAGFALRVRRQRVLQLFDKPGGKVLDVGCGPGEMVDDLLNLGCEFWGVDPSARMIEICRRKYSEIHKVNFQLGPAEQLDFADGQFDAVVCMGVIDGLQSAGAALREMGRVLKPGGTIIITFSNHRSPYAWWKGFVYYRALAVMRRIFHPRLKHDPIFVRRRLFTPQTATELLASFGMRAERTVGYFYNIILSPLDEIWPAATLWVNRKLEKARDGKVDSLAAGFIVKAVNTASAAEARA
ncbi:MAG: class I SAM-dependent methyltransferase [Candidatus Acidiferrales bacterium]